MLDLDTLLQELQDSNRFIRSEASYRLQEMGASVVDQLIPLLFSQNAATRRAAAATLAAIPDSRVVPALIAALQDGGRSLDEQWTLAFYLGRLDHSQAGVVVFAFYVDRFHTGGWTERRDAIYRIGEFPYPEADTLITQALRDGDEDVRKAAANAREYRQRGINFRTENQSRRFQLPRFASPSSDHERIAALLDELNNGFTEHVVTELGNLGAVAAVDSLMSFLERTNPASNGWLEFAHRLKTVEALALIGDPRCLPLLKVLTQTDTTEIDAWGMGVGLSIAEVAQETIEKIEWRLRRERGSVSNDAEED